MSYVCAVCKAKTERGALITWGDGTSALVALCPVHRNKLTAQMKAEGVPVQTAGKLN